MAGDPSFLFNSQKQCITITIKAEHLPRSGCVPDSSPLSNFSLISTNKSRFPRLPFFQSFLIHPSEHQNTARLFILSNYRDKSILIVFYLLEPCPIFDLHKNLVLYKPKREYHLTGLCKSVKKAKACHN